jgi:membrane-associated PAP2 superfamily phosphatase
MNLTPRRALTPKRSARNEAYRKVSGAFLVRRHYSYELLLRRVARKATIAAAPALWLAAGLPWAQ